MRESLRAQPDEPILVTASPHTVDLATAVAVEAYRAGADPAILFENDAFYYALFKHLTDAQLRKTSAHCLGLADYVRGYVWLQGVEDPSGMRRVPQPKFAAMFEGEEAHHRKSLEKKPKSVGVSLGLVTRARARTYGFNFAAWKRMMEAAIAVDYEEMGRAGKAVLARLQRPGSLGAFARSLRRSRPFSCSEGSPGKQARSTAPRGGPFHLVHGRPEARAAPAVLFWSGLFRYSSDFRVPRGAPE